jgi:hypothetical protein
MIAWIILFCTTLLIPFTLWMLINSRHLTLEGELSLGKVLGLVWLLVILAILAALKL